MTRRAGRLEVAGRCQAVTTTTGAADGIRGGDTEREAENVLRLALPYFERAYERRVALAREQSVNAD
ncbi:MAG: hypothetical protein QOH05_4586 [Acetobacteraceae bacterium]|jgi:hypothetical protein|nr:hypothetical protein [Acetobacteraceae bacterium]